MSNEAITIAESKRLIQLEKIIKAGEQTFVEVGAALKEIRDGKLYRADCDTFEEYCLEKWGWGRQRGYELIYAAIAVESLPEKCKQKITNENQASAISKIPPPRRREVLQSIEKAGEQVTAKTIAQHAAPLPPPRRAKPVAPVIDVTLDEVGRSIPDALLPTWENVREMEENIQLIARVKSSLKKAEEGNNLVYAHVPFQQLMTAIELALTELKARKPYCLCPDCHGKLPGNCQTCKKSGFIGRFMWEHQTAIEKKTIILKTIK